MPSPLVNQLSEKVRLAAAEIQNLHKDKERLAAELALMQEENRRARRLFREHEVLIGERNKIRTRLEKLMARLEKAGV